MEPGPHLTLERLVASERSASEAAHLAECARCREADRRLRRFLVGVGPPIADNATVVLDVVLSEAQGTGVAQAPLPDRYEDLGLLGEGGMGQVRRVRDRQLSRTAAMKIISTRLVTHTGLVERFVEEAQVAAQLQHPGLVPVYDAGILADGRAWFTMKEVQGRTLTDVIAEVHAASADGGWRPGPSGWTFPRLVDALASVCEAVGYAHAKGVLHRDLKPDNVMVGDHGEVLVLDWGIAKVLGRPGSDVPLEVDQQREATQAGTVTGTAAYMAPEQARGEVDRLDARTDVYGLGAILYEILAGRPPFGGTDPRAVLAKVRSRAPEPPGTAAPAELAQLCSRAMAHAQTDRFVDGAAVAVEVRAWLEGARRREQALAVVEEGREADTMAVDLRQRATAIRLEAERLLAGVKRWEPEERKAAGWAKADQAAALEREAGLAALRAELLLHGALQHDPGLPEAHAALAERYRDTQATAEAARDADQAGQAETRLRLQLARLAPTHPVRVACTTWLKGDGTVTLATDPPGAEVDLYRFELRNRRLVATPLETLGRTPLVDVSLPMGSYLCILRHPERAEVRYPVFVGRGEHWDGVRPGELAPRPVRLPQVGELGPDDCLVPAGWFWSGGDPEALACLPRRRLWCDDLVMRRFPVTNREYLAFLDDLVARGREDEALQYAPRERATLGEGAPLYGRDAAGRFELHPDADGDTVDLDYPVFLVDWFGATAYATWLAGRDGRPWRLVGELEWEKAARGVDGRLYPWGDVFDDSWCCMREGHSGRPLPAVVDSHPVDTTVYGVRGLAGNVQDWCAERYAPDGPVPRDDGLVPPPPPPTDDPAADPDVYRAVRGGAWVAPARVTRAAGRYRYRAGLRGEDLGFRVGYRPGSSR